MKLIKFIKMGLVTSGENKLGQLLLTKHFYNVS